MPFVRLYIYPARCACVGGPLVAAHDDARGQNRSGSPSFWPLHRGKHPVFPAGVHGPPWVALTVSDLQDSRRRAAGRTAGHQIKSLPSSAAASGVVLARAGGVNLTWDIMLPSPRRRVVLRPVISHQSERDTTLTLTPQQQAATSGTQLTGVLHSSFGFFPRRPPPETCYNNNTTYFVQDLVQMGEPAGANAVTR